MDEFEPIFSEIRELEKLKSVGNRHDIIKKLESLKQVIEITGKILKNGKKRNTKSMLKISKTSFFILNEWLSETNQRPVSINQSVSLNLRKNNIIADKKPKNFF